VIGLVGLLWSGLGVVGAMQYSYDQVWQVEERGIKDKLYGLAWLAGAVLVFTASAAATALLAILPGFLSPVALLVALATNVALWWWTAKILPNRDVGWRPLLPGAILGGVGLEVLKAVGGFYVPRLVSRSSQLYGSIGIVFAILAWLLLLGQLVVYSSVLNVVLWERRHGTVETLVEVPAQPDVGPDSTRMGRSEEAHGRAVA
jgi:membrane protein